MSSKDKKKEADKPEGFLKKNFIAIVALIVSATTGYCNYAINSYRWYEEHKPRFDVKSASFNVFREYKDKPTDNTFLYTAHTKKWILSPIAHRAFRHSRHSRTSQES